MWAIDVINALSTAVIAAFAFQSWQTANRMKWLTGAIERHSDQQRQIAAKKAGIEMIWWDKNQSPDGHFPHDGEHGDVNKLERLYVGIPEHRRARQRWLPSTQTRLAITCLVIGGLIWVLSKIGVPHDFTGLGFLGLGLGLGLLFRSS